MPEDDEDTAALKTATDRVLASTSAKKLVVAGPGAGKTFLFKELLKAAPGNSGERLVLTFINSLKGDLDRNLGELSQVYTLHSYSQYLLHRNEKLRKGLSEKFRCYPGLRHLIPQDWKFLKGPDVPAFIAGMREHTIPAGERDFYFSRCDYYDAVDFDDSVCRTVTRMQADASLAPAHKLVLIDEFQDFNRMEATLIELLASKSPIVIAGDDDQALYSALRGASWDHIRAHHAGGQYEVFELPFCMRCPEAIVGAVNDILEKALAGKKLNGRIQKPYRYYKPAKAEVSAQFPKIDVVETSVQRANANYFGRYIEECIRSVPQADVDAAAASNEPVALIIGSNPYKSSVEEHLKKVGLITGADIEEPSDREKGLQLLTEDPESNLGWRIILSVGNQETARDRIREAHQQSCPLAQTISPEQRAAVLAEAKLWAATHKSVDVSAEAEAPTHPVAITSYEGSKGRSAQYVFIIGAHSGEIPRRANDIKDIEICRFLVGLTRTKKKCVILHTKNAMGDFKQPSEFLGWIAAGRINRKTVNADYWKK